MFRLEDLGWGPYFQQQLNSDAATGLRPARVAEEMKNAYRVYGDRGPLTATLSGRLRHEAITRVALPASGDWVLVSAIRGEGTAVIHRVLERRTKLSRKVAGERSDEQIVAANIDTVFVVAALNRDFNPRRIERYLTAVWESGARPVVALSKADLHDDAGPFVRETQAIAPGVQVLATSTLSGTGIDENSRERRARRDRRVHRILRRGEIQPHQPPSR